MTKKYEDRFGVFGYNQYIDTGRTAVPREVLLDLHRRDGAKALARNLLENGALQETIHKYMPGSENPPGLKPGLEFMEQRLVTMRPGMGSLYGLVRDVQVEAIREWVCFREGRLENDLHIMDFLRAALP